MKKSFLLIFAMLFSTAFVFGQTIDSKIVENGGRGPYKAIVVSDESVPGFAIYRPENLRQAVAKEGKLPVVVFGNGGCVKSSIGYQNMLNELASYGYVLVAVGDLSHDTPEDMMRRMMEQLAATADVPPREEINLAELTRSDNPDNPYLAMIGASPLLEGIELIVKAANTPGSEYYSMLDLDKIAAMGQSCGGAETIGTAEDTRVKTMVVLNSGMGEMTMGGASPESVKRLSVPVAYLIGGPADVAYPNAAIDFERITQNIPVFMGNYDVGHDGTYRQPHGGYFAEIVMKWLDWQLKGELGEAAFFLDDDYRADMHPGWAVEKKNF